MEWQASSHHANLSSRSGSSILQLLIKLEGTPQLRGRGSRINLFVQAACDTSISCAMDCVRPHQGLLFISIITFTFKSYDKRFTPKRSSRQAVVTGVFPSPPPPGTCLHFYRAYQGSAFPLISFFMLVRFASNFADPSSRIFGRSVCKSSL